MAAPITPSQTVGPYYSIGMTWEDGPFVVPEGTHGAFRISGRVLDGAGDPVWDSVVEFWQADPEGRFASPDDPRGASETSGFRGFGRCGADMEGRYFMHTVKPGGFPGPSGPEAPHIDVSVFARGLLKHLVTRIYFPDEEQANAADPVFSSIEDAAARETLLAVPADDGYRFDVILQGEGETVFFDV
jgi:protocatechuate 3,4-dioxygenase alpha subunit